MEVALNNSLSNEANIVAAKKIGRANLIFVGLMFAGGALINIGTIWLFVAIYSSIIYDFQGDAEIVIDYGCNSAPVLSLGPIFTPASGQPFSVDGGFNVTYNFQNAELIRNSASTGNGNLTAGIWFSIGTWITFTGCALAIPATIGWIIYGAKQPKLS